MQHLIKKYEIIIVWAIFTLGAFLRLYHLDYPLGLHGDEAWSGIEARRILQTGWIGVWSPSALGQPTAPFYWTALIFKLFGESLISLRFSFALALTLVLPFFYLSVKQLFNRNIAIIAFLLFATSHIFIHFSHVAYMAYLVPVLPAIYFFLLALKTNKWFLFFIAGIFLGISPYFYAALRIFPLVFILFLSYKSLHKGFLKKYWKNIILFFLTALIIFLPLGMYGLQHTEDFMSRTNMVSIFSTYGLQHENVSNSFGALNKNIQKIFFMFFKKGDIDAQDNYNRLPVFDYFACFFFAVGFISQIFRLRKNEKIIFLYLWFFLFLTGTIFTVDAPNYRRIQPSLVASYVFVALGMVWIYQIAAKYIPKSKIVIQTLLGIAIAYIVYTNSMIFFTKQALDGQTKDIFAYPLVKAATFLQTQQQPIYTYFYSNRWSYHYETMRFLSYGISGEDRSNQFGKTYSLDNSHHEQTVVYLFLPDYEESFTTLREYCPQGKQFIEKDTDGQPIFFAYIIPKHICQ